MLKKVKIKLHETSPAAHQLNGACVAMSSLCLIKVLKLCEVQDLSAVFGTKCICSGTQVRFCPPPLHDVT